nr:DUF533 domain-containing protein [Vibrio cholerae]
MIKRQAFEQPFLWLIADEQNFMEKAYLNELAKQLGLDVQLIAQLNLQVSGQ